jgi:hypothetical protein
MARVQEEIDFLLNTVLPYRMHCLYALHMAIELKVRGLGAARGQFQVIDGDRTRAEGSAAGVINPWLEIGVIHGRALLEFLGLSVTEGRLAGPPKNKRKSDWYITDLGLEVVTPDRAIASYQGDAAEAEQSLVSIMTYANKSIAHLTVPADPVQYGTDRVQIAARGIHALVAGYVYGRLNRQRPEWGIAGN